MRGNAALRRRLMELDHEFPEEISQLEQRLRSVQLSDGGIPHFYDVEQESEVCKPCPTFDVIMS